MAFAKPCITCGELTRTGSYCQHHQRTTVRMGTGWATISTCILQRDNYLCQLRLPGCTRDATTVDHIVARSNGGTNDPTNLQAACRHCNSSKGQA